jgi:hypothetical protein
MSVTDIFLFPLVAPLKSTLWVLQQIEKRALDQLYNPDVLRAELLQLRISYERNTISLEEYREKSQVIWERLNMAMANDEEDEDDGNSTD